MYVVELSCSILPEPSRLGVSQMDERFMILGKNQKCSLPKQVTEPSMSCKLERKTSVGQSQLALKRLLTIDVRIVFGLFGCVISIFCSFVPLEIFFVEKDPKHVRPLETRVVKPAARPPFSLSARFYDQFSFFVYFFGFIPFFISSIAQSPPSSCPSLNLDPSHCTATRTCR